MKKFIPKSLAGQLIAVLLLALVVAQIASLAILRDDRRLAFMFSMQQQVQTRTATVIRILNKSEPELHQTILEAASSPGLRFDLSDHSAVGSDEDIEGFNRFLRRSLAWKLEDDVREIRVANSTRKKDDEDDDDDDDDDKKEEDFSDRRDRAENWFDNWRDRRHHGARFGDNLRRPTSTLTISLATRLQGPDKAWLNVYSRVPPTGPAVAIASLVTIAIMAVLVVIIVIFMIRRVTRPLADLADSAERFGRGESVEVLTERGPEDIRKASRAFNLMQERLTRFVKDRTLMLAAITHDLRTPITSLRIRAEMIEEGENRDRILETLAEMQALTEAALDFARQDAEDEPTRRVDLIALVDTVCADLTDLGHDIDFDTGQTGRLTCNCHPMALKRVFRNLVENAVRYGERARLSVTTGPTEHCISIEDDGPGISARDLDRIFEPFVRLEESRSQETGGIGLGLAIARTIVRAHGGDISVSSSATGGARFTVCLPRQDQTPD